MKRHLLASLLCAATLAPLSAWATVTARETVVLEADVVRLGDLFDGIGDKAQTAIARAPEPGQKVTLNGQWLAGVAESYGLDWKPSNPFLRISVERAGQEVPRSMVEQEILAALSSQGVPASAEVELANRAFEVMVPVTAQASVAIRDMVYDPRTQRFQATLEAPATGAPTVHERISGRVWQMVEVPVLTRAVGKGEVIGQQDVEWRRLRHDQVRRDTVVDAGMVIGQAAKTFLRPGAPLRGADLARPVAVSKNSLVTMVMRHGALQLTAQGRAVEDGSMGDVIRVTNTHSKLTVEAKVEAPNIVSVTPGAHVLAN